MSCCSSNKATCQSGVPPAGTSPSVDNVQKTGGCCNAASTKAESQEQPVQEGSQAAIKLRWTIKGMDCPSCAGKVEKAVKHIDGILSARVSFATERLLILAKTDSTSVPMQVKQAVNDAGFKLEEDNSAKKRDKPSVLNRFGSIILFALLIISATAASSVWPEFNSLFFSVATLWGLIPVVRKAWSLARSGSPFSIETLMGMAAIGALFLGETAEAAMVLLLFMLGEHLEAFAAGKARQGVQKLMALTPDSTQKINPDGSNTPVLAETLVPEDVIEVRPGERLPVDGELLIQVISFDESALTGESISVEHEAGSKVMAGSLVVDKVARLKVISKPGENTVDRIIRLIEEAEASKAPIERFIDRFSRWYTPAMMILAALVAIVPPLIMGQNWNEWIYKALALLLIGCPCALVISTPAAVTSALAAASRTGALVKGGAALEQLGKIQTIAFDKTGTLTEGKPKVTSVQVFGAAATDADVLAIAAAVEAGSTHPLAKAISDEAWSRGMQVPTANNIEVLAGLGVQGQLSNDLIAVGAPRHLLDKVKEVSGAEDILTRLEQQGNTIAIVTVNNSLFGIIALRDGLREDAVAAIQALKKENINSVMLTGDNPLAAQAIATELGMDFRAGLMPEDKSTTVMSLAQQGPIAMVGDGINDAPALKRADIGIAMGGGTDIALETADCALTHNRISELAGLIRLSKAALANIRQNVTLAIGLKAIFLITSILGITGLWMAILADTGATALVTANALRLLRHKAKA